MGRIGQKTSLLRLGQDLLRLRHGYLSICLGLRLWWKLYLRMYLRVRYGLSQRLRFAFSPQVYCFAVFSASSFTFSHGMTEFWMVEFSAFFWSLCIFHSSSIGSRALDAGICKLQDSFYFYRIS